MNITVYLEQMKEMTHFKEAVRELGARGLEQMEISCIWRFKIWPDGRTCRKHCRPVVK